MIDGTLIYSPSVTIVIESSIAGPIDVSEDASSGNVTLRENGAHSAQFVLENPHRKYDGMFVPNDRVIIQMKRFRNLQVFAGYLDRAPYFSTFPRSVQLTAQCPLKVLRYWPWDRGSQRAFHLIHGEYRDRSEQDGGMSEIVKRLLTDVAQWPEERIHIGRVPGEWFDKFEKIYQRLEEDYELTVEPVLGINPMISGHSLTAFEASGEASPVVAHTSAKYRHLRARPQDMDVILATIRRLESGGDYDAKARGSTASGAYQFIDSTWGNYRSYARAHEAPNNVQDERAEAHVREIINTHGDHLVNVPYGWYYPSTINNPRLLDVIPVPGAGNVLTPREYTERWMGFYFEEYAKLRGGGSPQQTATAPDHLSGGVKTSPLAVNADVIYPIPEGVNQLTNDNASWGGYKNGDIPIHAMKPTVDRVMGHPVAVDSWDKLRLDSSVEGLDLRGGQLYRSYKQQVLLQSATPGRSMHGWGLAMDIHNLIPGTSTKYPNLTRDQMYETPEFLWMAQNAYKYGWGLPSWAHKGGSKPEPWHWEFFAIVGIRSGEGGPGVNPFLEADQGLGPFSQPVSNQLFTAIAQWEGRPDFDVESEILSGYKALMNDEPLLPTVEQFVKASGRSYCSAPNGDFIAWFPDYWGEYGLAGVMEIEPIEVKDFSVMWDDKSLITHQYVEGAYVPHNFGPMPGGIMDGIQALMTHGVATVDMPGFMESVLNVRDSAQYPWLQDPNLLLQRFGARVDRHRSNMIYGPHQEFWMAISRFSRAWAAQFQASVPVTFMPELFPGMLMRIPYFGVQLYVSSVTHNWDLSGSSGFSTTANTLAISSTGEGEGFYIFPKSGDQRPSGHPTGAGVLYR